MASSLAARSFCCSVELWAPKARAMDPLLDVRGWKIVRSLLRMALSWLFACCVS